MLFASCTRTSQTVEMKAALDNDFEKKNFLFQWVIVYVYAELNKCKIYFSVFEAVALNTKQQYLSFQTTK